MTTSTQRPVQRSSVRGRRGDAVSELITAMAAGTGVDRDLFTDDAVLDATLPNWRFTTVGAGAIACELTSWYRHAGRVERLGSHGLTDGVAIEVDLTWDDDGVPHAAHQLHLIRLENDRIAADTVFCGGRWPADLLADMEAANAR